MELVTPQDGAMDFRIDETFSQFKEDVLILAALRGSGLPYFPCVVDVGANDGASWSNSRLFGIRGWNLVLIEPLPRYAEYCRHLYADNKRVAVHEKAISANRGTTDFYATSEPDRDLLQMGSSLSAETVPFGLKSTHMSVEACPLSDILSSDNVPKDYAILNVDAEGHDLAVLETAALDTWRPRVICVEMLCATEANETSRAIESFLVSKRYRYAMHTPANAIFVSVPHLPSHAGVQG